jgi:peroxiredoxin
MKKITIFLSIVLSLGMQAQNIQMTFPHFAGKSYDFIIFRGKEAKTVFQGTIPADGKFTLSVPKEYDPYTGMSRWLITGTQEGGGLDMLIPGHDFSVVCTEAQPNDENIIYTGNPEIPELTGLYKKQQDIFAKHDAMLQATKAFPKNDKNYPAFEKEYQNQLMAYDNFQKELQHTKDYASQFINIVNITQGIGTKILDSEQEKAKNIAEYMAKELDWQILYTSGHWYGVIASWAAMHSQVLNDADAFASDFSAISHKIKDPKQYEDFAKIVAAALTESGKDNFISKIAPIVTGSGKISSYEGSLSAFVSAAVGSQAPDLQLTADNSTVLRSKDFAGKEYRKTLLLFYKSDCGACEKLLEELPGKYSQLKQAGIRMISISADKDEAAFKDKAKDFLWKDAYADLQGFEGKNFKNYGVAGTPTLFLVDASGKIELRAAGLSEVLEYLKK